MSTLHLNDFYRPNDDLRATGRFDDSNEIIRLSDGRQLINSEVKIYNDRGELMFEPLHNKTVIAGSALTAMKLFGLNRNCLDNTPTYDVELDLDNKATGSTYPTAVVKDRNGNIVGSIQDETQRIICGFCVGQGGCGVDISDVFDVKYCSWITPDNLVPFRYPLATADNVDESMYKGKKGIVLPNGQNRNAYYFKTFSNTPYLEQNYLSSIGTFSGKITPYGVYKDTTSADMGNSYVECHLKITKDDCRDFFIAHKGLENAKINQISLVSAWTKTVSVTKMDRDGNVKTKNYEYFQDIRPFSLLNMPNRALSDMEESMSIVYTLFF